MRLWDAASRSCVAVGEGHVGAVAAVAFPPKSSKGLRFAVSGGSDRVLRVWDVEGARESDDGEMNATAATVAHDKSLNGVAVAPHLRMVATCSSDKTAKIWKMPDLVPLATLRGHRRGVWACAFRRSRPRHRRRRQDGEDLERRRSRGKRLERRVSSHARGSHCVRVEHQLSLSRHAVAHHRRDGLLNLWNVTAGALRRLGGRARGQGVGARRRERR